MLNYLNALTYLIQAHWTNTNTESTFCNTKFPWNSERSRILSKTWARSTRLFLYSKIRQRGMIPIQQASNIFRIFALDFLPSFTGIGVFSLPRNHGSPHQWSIHTFTQPTLQTSKLLRNSLGSSHQKKKKSLRGKLECASFYLFVMLDRLVMSSRYCYTTPHHQISQDFSFLMWMCWAK